MEFLDFFNPRWILKKWSLYSPSKSYNPISYYFWLVKSWFTSSHIIFVVFDSGKIENVEVVDGGLICSSGVHVEEMGDKDDNCYIVNAAVYVGYWVAVSSIQVSIFWVTLVGDLLSASPCYYNVVYLVIRSFVFMGISRYMISLITSPPNTVLPLFWFRPSYVRVMGGSECDFLILWLKLLINSILDLVVVSLFSCGYMIHTFLLNFIFDLSDGLFVNETHNF